MTKQNLTKLLASSRCLSSATFLSHLIARQACDALTAQIFMTLSEEKKLRCDKHLENPFLRFLFIHFYVPKARYRLITGLSTAIEREIKISTFGIFIAKNEKVRIRSCE